MSDYIELDTNEAALKATLSPILHLLDDDDINEIKISPSSTRNHGTVWIYKQGNWEVAVDKYGQQLVLEEKRISSIIGFMAGDAKQLTHEKNPILECAIPVLGYRFTGILQPASIGCSKFNIRKFSSTLYTFEDYVNQGLFAEEYIDVIRSWQKRDVFSLAVAGSTNSGKTTFMCSYINEKRKIKPNENWVVIEDTKELNIPAGNVDRLLTTRQVNMDDFLKTTLRLTPDNCVVGEVRGKEASTALELAKIKSVCFTMHAKGIDQALSRIERMILQHPDIDKISRKEIADNINAVISIQNVRYRRQNKDGHVIEGFKREVTEIQEINDYDFKHEMFAVTKIK